jgi:hypothetical protein
MVAKIISGKSLVGALNYNENKVQKDKAQLIDVNGYFKDLTDLNFYDKLFRLTDLADRNQRTKTNAVHISLNFANGEELKTDKLQSIIADYMEQIGFENQPYLAYRHSDAGHPHVHIVTTNIQTSGERISLHLLGKTKSEKARKAIEINYGLVQAEKSGQEKNRLEKVPLAQVDYGKTETKRAITNVVNITADRGAKDSRMYEKNGLVYWIMDGKGNKVGVPIKASSIYGKPTLKTLEDRFRLNEVLRKPLKEQLKNTIDNVLLKLVSKVQFQKELHEKGIQVVFRQNEEGRLYGVTFVDHRYKAVFNGSDLGKQYSAAMLAGRLQNMDINDKKHSQKTISIPANSNQRTDSFSGNLTHQNEGGSYWISYLKKNNRIWPLLAGCNKTKGRRKEKVSHFKY